MKRITDSGLYADFRGLAAAILAVDSIVGILLVVFWHVL
jgi:hypothetical protein